MAYCSLVHLLSLVNFYLFLRVARFRFPSLILSCIRLRGTVFPSLYSFEIFFKTAASLVRLEPDVLPKYFLGNLLFRSFGTLFRFLLFTITRCVYSTTLQFCFSLALVNLSRFTPAITTFNLSYGHVSFSLYHYLVNVRLA